MKLRRIFALGAVLAVTLAGPLAAKSEPGGGGDATADKVMALPWHQGPTLQPITYRAAVTLSKGVMALDPAQTERFLELTGNLPEKDNYAIAASDLSWFAVFDFSDLGYVKDDEKIDPDALLKSMRESQQKSNTERSQHDMPPLEVVGWSVVPHYDAASHNLEFGTKLRSADGENLNYTLRILGRRGVMNATLVTSQETLDRDLSAFRDTLGGFAFKPDESYAAYKDGDKVSEYGLAALITGGAAAAVLKGGAAKGILVALAAFWKIIAVGVLAFFAGIKRFFKRAVGGGEDLGPPPQDPS